jgi:hypothetical protein
MYARALQRANPTQKAAHFRGALCCCCKRAFANDGQTFEPVKFRLDRGDGVVYRAPDSQIEVVECLV